MRQLKFRAWDSYTKQLLSWESIRRMNYAICWLTDTELSKLHIMEYTGMTDSQGREIYEGDITEYESLSTFGASYGPHRFVVHFGGGRFHFVNEYDVRWGGFRNLKVIGNIWENPELVEPKGN